LACLRIISCLCSIIGGQIFYTSDRGTAGRMVLTMETPHEDLPKMRQLKALLEKALKKANEITPRAPTLHGRPDPKLPSPAAIEIRNALAHVDHEIEVLEKLVQSR
jgi:esterase/lipase